MRHALLGGWAAGCIAGLVLFAPTTFAEHRATRLGHPSTRFAPPLEKPEDLRARFRDPQLRPDIASILQQWNWTGRLEDLHAAAQSAPITELSLPKGTRLPFMSSRKDGKPITLRDVIWEGEEPISAYAFDFASNGRRYRCITPKPCSNFLLEDLGEVIKTAPVLALQCAAPAEIFAGRPLRVCLTARNTGDGAASGVAVTLPVPVPAMAVSASDNAVASAAGVTWRFDLGTNETKEVCVMLAVREPASLSFTPTVVAAGASNAQSHCVTRVAGIPAILLEAVDVADPVQVGETVTYEIRVTNQGSATGTNIRVHCLPAASQQFVSGEGATPVKLDAGKLVMDTLPALAPKAAATWRVTLKATAAADARFRIELSSDQFLQPITEEESTEQY